jgi:hypothetical protein
MTKIQKGADNKQNIASRRFEDLMFGFRICLGFSAWDLGFVPLCVVVTYSGCRGQGQGLLHHVSCIMHLFCFLRALPFFPA